MARKQQLRKKEMLAILCKATHLIAKETVADIETLSELQELEHRIKYLKIP